MRRRPRDSRPRRAPSSLGARGRARTRAAGPPVGVRRARCLRRGSSDVQSRDPRAHGVRRTSGRPRGPGGWRPRSGARRRCGSRSLQVAQVALGEHRVARAPRAAAPGTSQLARRRRRSAPARRRLGWSAANGMSATKSPTARAPAGGARTARRTRRRTSRGSRGPGQRGGGPDERGRPHGRRPRSSPARAPAGSGPGPRTPAGWCTAVLVSTTPRSWSRCASAQPSEIGAAPVVRDGHHRPGDAERVGQRAEVVDPLRAAARASPSARRSPCPSWSTATTRQPGGAAASSRRHR